MADETKVDERIVALIAKHGIEDVRSAVYAARFDNWSKYGNGEILEQACGDGFPGVNDADAAGIQEILEAELTEGTDDLGVALTNIEARMEKGA